MTKNEFLSELRSELKKNSIADADDIISEYAQHFSFKIADGFSEHEIANKLGSPAILAAQFHSESKPSRARITTTAIALCFSDLFFGLFLILMVAWALVMAATALALGALAVCLIAKIDIQLFIPYWCGAILAISFSALSVLSAVGTVFFAAFTRQLTRSYSRFHSNTMAIAAGSAPLPSVTITPQFPAKKKRRMRSVALVSLALFAVCLILGMLAAMLSSQSFEFWHTWNWFV